MFKILNKKCGKATASYRVLYLPYVTLIWGNSAENRRAEENAVKAITYRNTKVVYLSQYSESLGQIGYSPSFWRLSVLNKRFFPYVENSLLNFSFLIIPWAERPTLNA
jgi:hypothetical protein